MPSLDKAFSDFLKALRGEQSYASLATSSGSPNRPYTVLQTANNRRHCEKSRRSSAARTSLLPMFSEKRSPRRGAGENSLMQASSGPCHNIGNLRAIWSRLPLFSRFQLAGWAVFVPLTFPLKVLLAGTIPGAVLLSLIRDGSSFALTLGM